MSERTNIFAGLPLDRNAERRDDAAWAAAQRADPHARYVVLGADARGGRPALFAPLHGALRLLDAGECRDCLAGVPATYLGHDDRGPLFAVALERGDETRIADALGAAWIDLRGAGTRLPAFQSGLFAYARAIAHWQARTRWCSACGASLELVALGHRGKCTNAACGIEHFPRVDPAMIVIVSWQDRCLLGRQPSWPEHRWSTLAGFIEPGESLEDAVRREVFEEAGVRVGACEYHSSQPWPFPSSLMLGFTAEAIDPTIRVGDELSDARWFGVGEIVDALAARTLVLPPRLSVSHELIAHWLRMRGVELADIIGDEPRLRPQA